MRRAGDLGHGPHDRNVLRLLGEVVVPHKGAEGLAAKGAELLLIKLLEQRALVPLGARILLEHAAQLSQ